MTYALYHMIPQTIQRRHLPKSSKEYQFKSRWYEYARIEYKKVRKGFGTYKDSTGKTYFVHKDDPIIKELNLVWILCGYKFTLAQRKHMVEMRNGGRGTKIKVYFMSYKKMIFKDELNLYLDNGWKTMKCYEDKKDIIIKSRDSSIKGAKSVDKKLKNGMRVMFDKSGKSHGFMYKDDLRIKELDLVKSKSTEKQAAQRKRWLKASNDASRGKKLYNNGTENKLFNEEDVPHGWKKGGLSRNIKKSDLETCQEIRRKILNSMFIHSGIKDSVSQFGVTDAALARICNRIGINYHLYWDNNKRFKVDKNFAIGLYNAFDGDFTELADILNTNEYACRLQYKKLYNLE